MDYLMVVVENLLPVLAGVFAIAAVALVRKGLDLLEDYTGIKANENTEHTLAHLALTAVDAAEVWAAGKIKYGEPKPVGAEKLDYALVFLKTELERLGVTDVAEESLRARVEAMLGVRAREWERNG